MLCILLTVISIAVRSALHKNNDCAEMCSDSEEGSYSRLIDFREGLLFKFREGLVLKAHRLIDAESCFMLCILLTVMSIAVLSVKGTSLVRPTPPVGPCSSPLPRDLWWS